MLWRLLRIGSAPYFVLGNDRRTGLPARFRIASPWDWRDQFELVAFEVSPSEAGQPRVDWAGTYRPQGRMAGSGAYQGHVEIRWSHGRFAQPPEAKVYLDTPMSFLPGYHPLDTATSPSSPCGLSPAEPTVSWDGPAYQERFDRLAAIGADVHGEAEFVMRWRPSTVLDAGCGTGRVARELARRGIDTVGVDLDESMIETARQLAPDLTWVLGDLSAWSSTTI